MRPYIDLGACRGEYIEKFRTKNTLVIGPWLGEFGHELCRWIPHVRWLAWRGKYGKVIVMCRTGHEYLYADFANEFINDDTQGQTTEWLINGELPERLASYEHTKMRIMYDYCEDVEFVTPNIVTSRNEKQVFWLMYGYDGGNKEYDILIHARNTNKYNTCYRDWPADNWLELIGRYPEYRFASVGSIAESSHISGTADLRGAPLNQLARMMKGAKALLSPSSGTAHFASLCGTPHLVWTDNKKHGTIGAHTNADRYKRLWNPFCTKCEILQESWQPTVGAVCDGLKRLLNGKNQLPLPITQRQPQKKKRLILTRLKQPEGKKRPVLCMVTYNRPEQFDKTMKGLIASDVTTKHLYVFDDCSMEAEKNNLLRGYKNLGFNIIQNSKTLGVFFNSTKAVDFCYSLSNDAYIVYLQDDIAFSANWYKNATDAILKMNRDGVDWGVLALVHYRGQDHRQYHIMNGGHPGGAAWIINREMWAHYRKDNNLYDSDLIGGRLFDHRVCHWCHHNGKRQWAVCYTGKSLVKHVGAKSSLHDRNMAQYEGENYAG